MGSRDACCIALLTHSSNTRAFGIQIFSHIGRNTYTLTHSFVCITHLINKNKKVTVYALREEHWIHTNNTLVECTVHICSCRHILCVFFSSFFIYNFVLCVHKISLVKLGQAFYERTHKYHSSDVVNKYHTYTNTHDQKNSLRFSVYTICRSGRCWLSKKETEKTWIKREAWMWIDISAYIYWQHRKKRT